MAFSAAFPELSEIRALRRRAGLTQAQLAERAGVSQSLVAKVESGKLSPGYAVVQKVFSALDEARGETELRAGDVMKRRIVFLHPGDSVKSAVAVMRRHAFSQVPVMEGSVVVGLVTEGALLDAVTAGKARVVREVMAEAPPIVPKNASAGALTALLKIGPVVLVQEGGKAVGLVTKSDLLEKLYSRA